MPVNPTGVAVAAPATPLAPLHAYRQFIVVKLVPLPNGRTDKIPMNPYSGTVTEKGSDGAHNPLIWLSHDEALALATSWGPQFTIGFVLTEADPFWCLDIDGAATPAGWSSLATTLCASLPGTAVEVSQSGQGLHIWGQGVVPPHAAKNVPLHIELYTERRFIALGSGAVGDMTQPCPTIAQIAAAYFPPRVAAAPALTNDGPRADWRGPTDDNELLRRAMRSQSAGSVFGGARASFADLWHAAADVLSRNYPADANSSEPFDRSSADAALFQHLAFWTGCDRARMLTLAQKSKLARDKWDREDYTGRTIENACRMCTNVLQDKLPEPSTRGASDAAADNGSSLRQVPAEPMIRPETPLNTARIYLARRHTRDGEICLRVWQGGFYEWGGAAWAPVENASVTSGIYALLDTEAQAYCPPSKRRVADVLDALRHAPGVHLKASFCAPGWLTETPPAPPQEFFSCTNGLLHIPTRKLHPPTPLFFNLTAAPFAYADDARAPREWLRFLAEVWPNDDEAVALLQEMFGYLLTPDTSQQKIFLVVGAPRSGKGTIARVLTALLGPSNVASPALGDLSKNFGLEPTLGKTVAFFSDARMSDRTDMKALVENLLRVSGEDTVTIDRKHEKAVTVRPSTRFVLLTNDVPHIPDASRALASRFVILKMNETFLGREDPTLTARLLIELPAILNWAVDGWHRLNKRGKFLNPSSSASTAQDLADLGSPISKFVREECIVGPGFETEKDALFHSWQTWCAREGAPLRGDKGTFARDLKAAFPQVGTKRGRDGGQRVQVFTGITEAARGQGGQGRPALVVARG